MKFVIKKLTTVSSTNTLLSDMYSAGEEVCNIAVCADYQTGGKGLGVNRWFSDPALNLLFSLGCCPINLHPSRQFLITKVVALAITDSVSFLCPDVVPQIKWPNDIWVGYRKLAGILISNIVEGNSLTLSIIGVGINVQQTEFPTDLPNPVSLQLLTDTLPDRMHLLNEILIRIEDGLSGLENETLNKQLHENYLKALMGLNQWQQYVIHDTLTEACIRGVDEYGQLIMEHRTGKVITYGLKEVKFVLPNQVD